MALVRSRPQLSLRLPLPPQHHSDTSWTSSSPAWPSLSELERVQVLGHGNGGTVYKVKHRKTGDVYALKVVRSGGSGSMRRERDILLRATGSPHVVRCHAVFEQQDEEEAAILMEYMEGGTLEGAVMGEAEVARVAKQVLSGLAHLHSRKIVHRDIKPSNLLVSGDVVKIADFGVSKMLCRSLEACNSYVGTCAYMSPERFDPHAYAGHYDAYAADVWSLGLTLMELYLGHFPLLPPGQRPDWATLMCAICFGDAPQAPAGASHLFRHFLDCCLHKDSANRSSASQLLNHPFLSISS